MEVGRAESGRRGSGMWLSTCTIAESLNEEGT